MRRGIAMIAAAASVVGTAGVVAAGGPAQATTAVPAWLARVNAIRVASGLNPVSDNPAWDTGLRHHLTYLDKTPAALITGEYASWHTENPASPYYTPDGALEGSRSDLGIGATDVAAINQWLEAPFHATAILAPNLTQVAFVRVPSDSAGLDVLGGLTNSGPTRSSPVLFPGDGSSTDLTSFNGGESPTPLETCRAEHPGADYSDAGLPLIAMLPAAVPDGMTASLTGPDGVTHSSSSAAVCLVDSDTYVTSDPVYGDTGSQILSHDHAVFVIPRTPLVNGAYRVRLTAPSAAPVSWSFTVAARLSNLVRPRAQTGSRGPGVGRFAAADPGRWTLGGREVISGLSYRYQWYVNGARIARATQYNYRVRASDIGKRLSVSVTASVPGYPAVRVRSAPSATVRRGTFRVLRKPVLHGVAQVGSTLRIDPGHWAPHVRLRFAWYANGKRLRHQTRTRLTLTRALTGKRIRVVVIAGGPGFVTRKWAVSVPGPVRPRPADNTV